jgi:hypothetical protein
MKSRCPFCHTEMEIPEAIGASGFCNCGAYGQTSLLSDAHRFLERAKKALGAEEGRIGRFVEVVDGGMVFEGKEEPVIIQWAKKPMALH